MSLLIPLGRFPYFVNACLRNVTETAGVDLDIVFVTNSSVPGPVVEALVSRRDFRFRVAAAPFDSGPSHQYLLDWAMREAGLSEWVVVQHSDVFWKHEGWAARLAGSLDTACPVVCTDQPSHHSIDGAVVPLVGDSFGVYHRPFLVENGLTFVWGKAGTAVPLSTEASRAIAEGRTLKHARTSYTDPGEGRRVKLGDWIDGSVAMSWEMALRFPGRVRTIPFTGEYLHLIALYRLADSVRHVGAAVHLEHADLRFSIWRDAVANYSQFTSFVLSRQESEGILLPWPLAERALRQHWYDPTPHEEVGRWLGKYRTAGEPSGLDCCGLEEIVIEGRRYPKERKVF